MFVNWKVFFSGNFKIMREKVKLVLVKPDDELKRLHAEALQAGATRKVITRKVITRKVLNFKNRV